MFYQVDDILNDVKVCMDENMGSKPLFEDQNYLSLEELIRSKIIASVRHIEERADILMIDNTESIMTNSIDVINIGNNYTEGFAVVLPNDFFRMISVKMDKWTHPVQKFVGYNDYTYMLQRSKFAGIKGNIEEPVCAIVQGRYGLQLEIYGAPDPDELVFDHALYLPEPKISDIGVSISSKLYNSVIYHITGSVLLTLNSSLSKPMFEMSLSLANISQ